MEHSPEFAGSRVFGKAHQLTPLDGLTQFDPDGDHYRLTRELNGRRVNLAMPHDSLLLEKAGLDREKFKPQMDAKQWPALKEELTRVWFTICTDDTTRSEAELREFQTTIFGQDAPVLESQRPRRLPLAGGRGGGELHSAADRLSAAYRRWVERRYASAR